MLLVQMLDKFRRQKGIIMKRHKKSEKGRWCDRHDNSTFHITSTTRLNTENTCRMKVHFVTAIAGKLAAATLLAVTVMASCGGRYGVL